MIQKQSRSVISFLLIAALFMMPYKSSAQLSILSANDLFVTDGEIVSFDGIIFTPNMPGATTGYSFPVTTLTKTEDWLPSNGFLNPHLKKYYSFSNLITGYTGSIIVDHSDVSPKVGRDGTTFNDPTQLRLNVNDGTVWTVPTSGVINSTSVEGTITTGTLSRFAVSASTAPLPVTMLSFSGKLHTAGVLLNWVTASEFNSSHFDVERSGNGTSFAKIGSVSAAGNSSVKKNYEYLDNRPLPKQSWYRLKQVDLDGKYTYSSVLPISRDAKISSYPNPVTNNLQLQLSQDWKGIYDLMIFDNTGKLMMKQQIKAGSHIFDCANWAAGIYNVLIYQENQQVYEQKIFKN